MKKIRVAINGFGRIGRLSLRVIAEREDVEVVAINDPFLTVDYAKYLLEHDSIHGKFKKEVKVKGDKLVVYFADGQPFIIVDKPENRALIKKIVLDLSGLEFVAKKKLVLSDDNTKSYLKSLFDNDLKIK